MLIQVLGLQDYSLVPSILKPEDYTVHSTMVANPGLGDFFTDRPLIQPPRLGTAYSSYYQENNQHVSANSSGTCSPHELDLQRQLASSFESGSGFPDHGTGVEMMTPHTSLNPMIHTPPSHAQACSNPGNNSQPSPFVPNLDDHSQTLTSTHEPSYTFTNSVHVDDAGHASSPRHNSDGLTALELYASVHGHSVSDIQYNFASFPPSPNSHDGGSTGFGGVNADDNGGHNDDNASVDFEEYLNSNYNFAE